jgi:pimeloyl-ACP methyl ester carboxylesterase
MRQYEIGFATFNAKDCSKALTALVIEPDNFGPNTGALLCSHGWGNNRFWDAEKMKWAADRHDLLCVSVEFRQSGFDASPLGYGWDCPYDFGYFQLFDVLNGLREVLSLRPGINRKRLFHYGGSQGGHLALMSAIVAPRTFAAVYASCPGVCLEPTFEEWAGREFMPHERSMRNAIEHADRIECPVFLDHGTADAEVSHLRHTQPMEARLRELGKPVTAVYYEGGDHQLRPVSSRLAAFQAMAPRFLQDRVRPGPTDWDAGLKVELPCAGRMLAVDWSQPATSSTLFQWKT